MNKNLINECEIYIQNKLKFSTSNVLGKTRTHKLFDFDEASALNYINSNKSFSFSEQLFHFIDETGEKDSDIYKRAHIDRRLFSKIRKGDYIPSKKTVICLCMGLTLTKENTDTLLNSAGYALSNSDIFDLVISFCIESNIYDIDLVNEILNNFVIETL